MPSPPPSDGTVTVASASSSCSAIPAESDAQPISMQLAGSEIQAGQSAVTTSGIAGQSKAGAGANANAASTSPSATPSASSSSLAGSAAANQAAARGIQSENAAGASGNASSREDLVGQCVSLLAEADKKFEQKEYAAAAEAYERVNGMAQAEGGCAIERGAGRGEAEEQKGGDAGDEVEMGANVSEEPRKSLSAVRKKFT